ncbi:MAG: orotidine-5'-phosphate decarboxylase [Pseudomonadota bacterium]
MRKNKLEPKQRLVFALDVPTAKEAHALVGKLHPYVGYFKIGLELFVAAGPDLVREIAKRTSVFLDLKLHDIPATVGRTANLAKELGVAYLSIHADEGGQAVRAAVGSMGQGILLVTVLTSIQPDQISEPGGLQKLVEQKAAVARKLGCSGVICSGLEAARVRRVVGEDLLIVTPGIRPMGVAAADQSRIATPAQAIANGADLLVVGRPIRDAPDPVAAAKAIVAEIAKA